MTMNITSSAFDHNGSIPRIYTCEGKDISPPLSWSSAPAGAKSLVLIVDDPDAPGHTWDGDIEQFAQLQRVAYQAAKTANPDAIVHLGAFTYFWDPGYFARFLDVLAADPDTPANDFYFDVATAHLYFQRAKSSELLFGDPTYHRELLAQRIGI